MIVERAQNLLGTDLSYITLLDQNDSCVRMRVAYGTRTPNFINIVLQVGEGLGGVVAQHRRATYTRDYLNDSRIKHRPDVDEVVRAEGIRSILGVPLNGRAGVVGVLYVANRHVNTYKLGDIELLATLGNHAALAVERASLYEEAIANAKASAKARKLAETRNRELSLVQRVHEELTDVLLAGGGVSGIAASLSAELSVVVTITDRYQFVLARAAPQGVDQDELDPSGSLTQTLLADPEVRSAVANASSDLRAVRVQRSGRLICSVATREEVLGFLWARLPAPIDPSGALVTAIEQAARVVALEMLRERAAEDARARDRRDFLDDLLSERPPPTDVLRHRARRILPVLASPHRPYVCLAVTGDGGGDTATRLIEVKRTGDFVASYGDRTVGFLSATEPVGARRELDDVLAHLKQAGLRAGIVMCGVCRDFRQDRRAIRKAQELQDLLGESAEDVVLELDRLEVLTTLFDPTDAARLERWTNEALHPILSLPARQRDELLRTLAAYYQVLGNRAAAARQLGIHINTLYRRIDRLAELLGPLDDQLRAVPLQVATLAWTLRRPRG